MTAVRNAVFYAMIPVNVLMILWVWVGRMLFGAGGWYLLILLMSAVPVLVVTLGATTVLAFTQRQPRAGGRITGQQALAQCVTWLGLLGFGFFLVDFGDAPESDASAFSQLFGRDVIPLSHVLTLVTGGLAAAAWLWLLIVLIRGNVQAAAQRREAAAAYAASAAYGSGYAAPYGGPATAPPPLVPPSPAPPRPPDTPHAPPGSLP